MQVTKIGINPNTISLTYNIYDNTLSGNTSFFVTLQDFGDEPATDFNVIYYIDTFFTFNPISVDVDPPKSEKVDISIDDSLFSLTEGSYSYQLIASNSHATDLIIPVSLNVINDSSAEPEIPKEYLLKYKLEHKDVENNDTLCEIYQLDYQGDVIPIRGYVNHNYQSKTDLFEPIIASNIKLELESSLELTLSDLYSEEEKEFKVILKRNNQVIFIGFIKPDGIYEDYVFDKWILSIDAYDGLSTLKNLSFVSLNGLIYFGKYTVKDVIINALNRTGLNLPLNINCDVFYEGFVGNNSLDQVTFNMERYYTSNSGVMNCEDVLKSTLQVFNLAIIQMFGEWWVYRPIDVTENIMFTKYIDGFYDSEFTLNNAVSIGSQIDDFELFHCNANQKKSIGASVQAYRIVYEYGGSKSVFKNPELKLSGSGFDIEGWTVNTSIGGVWRLESGYGLASDPFTGQGSNDPRLISLNQSIDIVEGSELKLIVGYGNYRTNTVGLRFSLQIGNMFYNLQESVWQSSGIINQVINSSWDGYIYPGPGGALQSKRLTGKGDATFELTIRAPMTGLLDVVIFRDRHNVGNIDNPTSQFNIYNVSVVASDSGNVKGRQYTAQRISKKSTVTKSDITVYNGDSLSDLFVGTIYKGDGDTPTSKWRRGFLSTEEKEILEINAEDNLRLSPRPMTIFEGDIYGYIPYLSLISINNFEGKQFQPINYSYQTNINILKLSSKEFSNDYIPETDFTVTIKDNYGNEQNVSIT